MRNLWILSCLFFAQITQAMVLHVNQNDSLVYFHPAPYLELELKETPGQITGTLAVTLNYVSKMIQREFNSLMGLYTGYDIKIAPVTNVDTLFTLDLPTLGIRQDFKLRYTNMGPYFSEKITLTPEQKIRFKNSKPTLEASVFNITVRANYISSVEVERYEADPAFCDSLKVVQVKDMILALGKIKKPASIEHPQTFDSLKYSALRHCFELENPNVNSFAELLQSRVLLKPESIAIGSHFEKKPQQQIFQIQPSVDVVETAAE